MSNLQTLVKAVINSEHGWAVADQFSSTFEGESFEEQNGNALNYIRGSVKDLLMTDLLNEDAQEMLREYYNSLVEYLAK